MTADLYTLPDLPYDYGALEPHISARILELHHDKHHAGYVKGANAALAVVGRRATSPSSSTRPSADSSRSVTR
jgi:Fe-Mn family superoxide dismutase